jgi:hypothetical protein
VAVPSTLFNARLTLVERVDRSGIGGDIAATTIVYTGAGTALDCVYEPTDRLFRLPDQREIVLSAELFVDLEFLAAWIPGDLISWVDQVGRTHTRGEVVQADVEGAPTQVIQHWRLRIAGA